MQENDNKWLDAVKDAVEGIENPLPEGMWESISSGIAAGRRRRRIIAFAVSTAAAAALAALAVILPLDSGTGAADPMLAQKHNEPAPISDETVLMPENEGFIPVPQNDATGTVPAFKAAATVLLAASPASGTVADNRAVQEAQSVIVKTDGQPEQREPADKQPEKQQTGSTLTQRTKTTPTTYTADTQDILAMAEDTGSHDYAEILSAGIHLSLANGSGTPSSSLPAVSTIIEDPESGTMMPMLPEGDPTGFRSEYVHNMPVNLGLSLSIGLAPALSLETGFVWSYHSACKNNWFNDYLLGSNIQRMHYAGIPLGLRYTPLEGRRTSLYLYGGVMAQKCVSASWNGSKLNNISPVILSSHLSAGFQYRIAGPIAFYIEPGISHNSVTGDEGFTMYGQHPWQFDLKGGIRFNIK